MRSFGYNATMVRVRIAPSPTGIPHIGNTRTALFNFLFAKHHGDEGKFILRIEDTDRARLVPESENAIREILTWLGLFWDEEYKQSERIDIYKQHAEKLLEKGLADKDEGAIRFKMPKDGETFWDDLIGWKHISFKNDTQEDFIIIKSDGFPTYNFANVVDDHLMNISHVIRGEEFISSTPKHIQLYKAFGWEHPHFAHLPIVLGPDKAKLSKRHGAKSILDYRDEGFLKEALLNYMALLGWRAGGLESAEAIDKGKTPHVVPASEREIMPLDFMIKIFDLKDVNTANPIFDIKKLEWFNGAWIRKSGIDLKSKIVEFIGENYSSDVVEKTVPLVRERMKTLVDYLPLCEFFFHELNTYEVDMSSKKNVLENMWETLHTIEEWNADIVGNELQKLSDALHMAHGEFFMLIRVAITGKKISPPLSESLEILGKEETLKRLKRAAAL